ncbi:MAG TPA: hypothetical protein VGD99_24230 [Anaerolineae bacterium]|jgi:hypothetical protein
MALTALDEQHFYVNEQLIDLVWIGYHVKKQMSAANHHDLNRRLNWLHDLANRLLTADTNEHDERTARKILRGLGYGWYFEDS